jgi:hypothetical protein
MDDDATIVIELDGTLTPQVTVDGAPRDIYVPFEVISIGPDEQFLKLYLADPIATYGSRSASCRPAQAFRYSSTPRTSASTWRPEPSRTLSQAEHSPRASIS